MCLKSNQLCTSMRVCKDIKNLINSDNYVIIIIFEIYLKSSVEPIYPSRINNECFIYI
jgi:hypothetical protein